MPSEVAPTILVVDDSATELLIVSQMLEQAGFHPILVNSGFAALQVVEKTLPDAILLDIIMPGMEGFEVCRRLKHIETLKNVPILFMTSLSDSQNKIIGFQVGGNDYITKPFQQEEVLARLHHHLEFSKRQGLLKRDLVSHKETMDLLSKKIQHIMDKLEMPMSIISAYSSLLCTELSSLDRKQIEATARKIYDHSLQIQEIIRTSSFAGLDFARHHKNLKNSFVDVR